MDVGSYPRIPMSAEETAQHDKVFGELAQRTREFLDASMRTTVEHAVAEEVAASLELLSARLLEQTVPGPLGIQIGEDGTVRNQGNAVVGLRNPVAPPLQVERSPEGRARASFHLGVMYEGPPGLVHGGISALILDQMLGEAAGAGGSPGMTGTLTLRYRRPTPLGDLSVEAWIDRVEGYKTLVQGRILDDEGNPTVEAEGLFILPRWAREATARQKRPTTFE